MKEIECEGKTVTIAVEAGLKDIGLRRDQVEVQVLEEGSTGILGFGMKPARVLIREKRWGDATAAPSPSAPSPSSSKPSTRARLSSARPARAPRPLARPNPQPPRPAPAPAPAHRPEPPREPKHAAPAARKPEPKPEPRREERRPLRSRAAAPAPKTWARPRRDVDRTPRSPEDAAKAAAAAQAVLCELLGLAGLSDAVVTARWDAAQDRVQADVKTSDSAAVLGKDGRTLEALQFLTTIIVGRRTGAPAAVQVECEGWWKQIEAKLDIDADKAAAEVVQTGRPFQFEPMDAAMRRLVHRRLAAHPEVETASEGEGAWRKVVVRAKRKD